MAEQCRADLKVQGRMEAAGSWSERMTDSPMTAGAGSSSASLVCLSAITSPVTHMAWMKKSIGDGLGGWGGGRERFVVRKDGVGQHDCKLSLSLHTNSVSVNNSHGMDEE